MDILKLEKAVPLQKLRPAIAYLNARQYGLSRADSRRCAETWKHVFNTCFTQKVAGQFYNLSSVNLVNLPPEFPNNTLYVTAHFCAYTFASIAIGKHYDKEVHIVVGTPPKEFEEYLVNSMADAGVKAIIIRSDFSQLRKIKRAMEEDAVIFSLIDVPWHRTIIPNREHEYFKFGAGEIRASRSIFKIATRLNLTPRLVLCEPTAQGFDVVDYGCLSQEACFDKLAEVVKKNPGYWERFSELHCYYRGGIRVKEIASFALDKHRFVIDPIQNKFWKLSQLVSSEIDALIVEEKEHEASAIVLRQIRTLTDREYDEVVYF